MIKELLPIRLFLYFLFFVAFMVDRNYLGLCTFIVGILIFEGVLIYNFHND